MKTWNLFCALCLAAMAMAPLPVTAVTTDLLEMSDEFDRLDKQDFQEAIDKATSCTRMRDFSCAESELAKAAKVANGGQDKKILLASRQSLANERQQLANERRRAEEERQAQIRREEEAEQERQARRRREEQAAEAEEESSYSASNDIGMHILQMGQENAAILADLNRQTTAAYAETNRRLAEQAAERKRAREKREEREAERRRDAARERDRARRVADARERDEADARERRAAEESRAQQEREQRRRDEERRNQEIRDSNERKRIAAAEEAKRKADAAAAKASEERAKSDYLNAMRGGIRLSAVKCLDGEGHYYATGSMPKMKRVLSCIDVSYKAYCPGSAAYSSGVARNFIGMGGCAGETYQISPKPGCPVEQVRIEVTDVRPGCN